MHKSENQLFIEILIITWYYQNVNTISNNNRIAWIDIAKGYGIILVILGHIGFGRFGTWIYSFHLPLFYFLSGYTFSTYKSFSVFIKKKVKTLLLPYLLISLSFLLFYRETHTETFITSIIVQKRYLLSWFLASLLAIELIFYPILKYLKTFVSKIGATIILVFVWILIKKSVLPWNIDVALFASPFFIVGYEFKRNKIFDSFTKTKQIPLCILMFVINIITTIVNIKTSGYCLELFAAEYGCIPLTYISAFSGILFITLLSQLFSNRYFEYIGRKSIFFYGIHLSISIPIARFLLQHFGIIEQNGMLGILFKMILLILILVITTLLSIVFYYTKEMIKQLIKK